MQKFSDKQKQLILLLLLIALGAFLRIYKLDFQSLSNDELSSWNLSHSVSTVSAVIQRQAEHDVNPPGFQIILFYIIRYFGDSEFWLRLPSAAAGIFSVYFIFLLGRKLFSAAEGLFGAALTAVSWCPVYYSQEARAYSILFLFSIVTTLLWVIITRETPSGKLKFYLSILLYWLSALITISLHYSGLLLICIQGLGMMVYFLAAKKSLKPFLIAYGIILIAFIPFLPALLIDFNPSFETSIQAPGSYTAVKVLLFFFNNSFWFAVPAAVLYLFLLIKIIYDKKIGRQNDKNSSSLVILTLWLLLPFTASYMISVFFLPVLQERNLIISLPAALLFFSHALIRLPLKLFLKRILIAVLLFLFLYHLAVKTNYYGRPTKTQFREAVNFVAEKENSNPEALIIGYSWSPSKFNYYFEKMHSNLEVEALFGSKNDTSEFQELIKEYEPEYFWYIYGHREPEQEFLDFLNKTYKTEKDEKFIGAGVALYRVQ